MDVMSLESLLAGLRRAGGVLRQLALILFACAASTALLLVPLPAVGGVVPQPITPDNQPHASAYVNAGTVQPFSAEQNNDGTSSANAVVSGSEQGAKWLATADVAFNPIDQVLKLRTGAYAQAPPLGEHQEYAIWRTGATARVSFDDEVALWGLLPWDIFASFFEGLKAKDPDHFALWYFMANPTISGNLVGDAHVNFSFTSFGNPLGVIPGQTSPGVSSARVRQDSWYDLGLQPPQGEFAGYLPPYGTGIAVRWDFELFLDDNNNAYAFVWTEPFSFSMNLSVFSRSMPNDAVMSAADYEHTATLGPLRLLDSTFNAVPIARYLSLYSRSGIKYAIGSSTPPTPNAFSFAPQTGVSPGTLVTSETITPTGFGAPVPISVSNGTYSLGCTGTFTGAAGTISPSQSVCVRHTASSSPGATATTVLTIGGVSGGFSSTTAAPGQFALAISRSGDGIVASAPAAIDCGSTCSASFVAGLQVALTATPAVESTFTGWSGDCSGTGACAVTMTANHTVGAGFAFTPETAQKVSALYIAFFFRAADFDGLGFWKNVARDAGLSDLALMREMAAGFANHPSFTAMYGAMSNAEYVEAIYLNVGGQPTDTAGRAYWLGQLNGGQLSRSDFVADFVYGLLEITVQTLQDLVNSGAITELERQDALRRKFRMTNKAEVAQAFLNALGTAANLSPGTNPLDPSSLAADPAYRASQNIIRIVTEDSTTKAAPLNYLAGSPTIAGINTTFGP